MIFGVSGVPGAGKSYYIVSWLYDNYYDKDGFPTTDYTIITNVDDLRLDHINLNEILKDIPIERFFTVEYQKKVTKKYNKIIYIIDECQQFFPRHMKNRDVFYYFEYHRHLGHIICLSTQNFYNRVSPEISALLEYEIRAVPRSLAIPGTFRYFRVVNREKIGTFFLRQQKKIFRQYKSAETVHGESRHIKMPMKIPLIISLCLMLGSGYLVYKRWWSSSPSPSPSSSPSSSSHLAQGGAASALPPPARSGYRSHDTTAPDRPHMIDDDDQGFWVELPYMSYGHHYFIVCRGSGRLVALQDIPFPVRTGRRGARVIIEGKVDDRYLQYFVTASTDRSDRSDRSTLGGGFSPL